MNEFEITILGILIKYQIFTVNDIEIIKPLIKYHCIGIRSEYRYLKYKFPDYKTIQQVFKYLKITGDYIPYDIITIQTADNEIKDVYFDISEFMIDYKNFMT
jgi:transposase